MINFYIARDGDSLQIRVVFRFPHWFQALRLRRSKRVPGLLAGAFQVSDDFDDPLPEVFLIASE